jgi:hypothetical protein
MSFEVAGSPVPMTEVLWHVTMSLDGCIESRDQSTGRMFGHGKPGPVAASISPDTEPMRLRKTRCDDPGQINDLTFEVVR